MPLLTCNDLTVGYDGKAVVSGLDFSVNAGEYWCVVGDNGSGKSTLIKTLLGLRPPITGRVAAGEGFKMGEIGYLPQQTVVQRDFPASVREVVLSGCLNRRGFRPFYNRAERQAAGGYMKRLGILHLSKKCYRELSGGQQQRVLLARALCATRKILLLDEPAAGLDATASAEMYELIRDLNQQGLTIIMITHDMAASATYATHILHIGNRSALYCGAKDGYAVKGGVFDA